MSDPATELLHELRAAVGRGGVLTDARRTLRYRRGYRTEAGPAVAVVKPRTLVQLWRALAVVVSHDAAVILQAANTGLTGGSTPDGKIGRPVVIINTMRLAGIHPLNGCTQVVCLPGATLHQLERVARRFGREPHSVIGSSCFGASVIGGICNNSGGALVRRGPAYTELALFARMGADGVLELVNRLGIDLCHDPETMLTRLEAGRFATDVAASPASDPDYRDHVRAVDEPSPARFNADPRRLCDASGSAGRVAVFAVRLDTFPKDEPGTTFYIGSNDVAEFSALRRALLSAPGDLPISAEYLHRDAFDIADRYGRDTFVAIRALGTDRLPSLLAVKAAVDGLGEAVGVVDLSERLLQRVGRMLPDHLLAGMRAWRMRFEHHLILKVDDPQLDSTRELLSGCFPSETGDLFECSPDEAARATLHRFVTAGAAVRYRAVHRRAAAGIVALDVALLRNATDWFGALPAPLDDNVIATLRYGHFLCHVFHRDYIVKRGSDPAAGRAGLIAQLDREKAEYPAEHNVGRHYAAKPALVEFYRRLDPTNRFNPGIGMTQTGPFWSEP